MRRRRLGMPSVAPGRPSAPATRPETRCASARSRAAPLASDAAMADRADSPAARVRPQSQTGAGPPRQRPGVADSSAAITRASSGGPEALQGRRRAAEVAKRPAGVVVL